jgi:hypothetical protein
MMSNVRELTMFFNGSDGRTQPDVVFPFLHRLKNLTVLELLGCSAGIQLNSLPQNYVHQSLRALRIHVDRSNKLERVWDAIPRQFPQLTALHVGTSRLVYGHIDSRNVKLEQFRRLESITLKGFDVPLGVALDLCACATIKSVVCHSFFCHRLIPTPDQTLMIAELCDAPGCRVDFHLANGDGGSYFRGGFRFAFSRS